MRGTTGVFLAAMVILALQGCGGGNDNLAAREPQQPPPQATGDVVGLRVFVSPAVAIAPTACTKATVNDWTFIVINDVQASLSKAGFVVVADPNVPLDATLTLRATLLCFNANEVYSLFVNASLEGQRAILGQAQARSASGRWPDEVVRQLLTSPTLASYASTQKAKTDGLAATTVAPASSIPLATPLPATGFVQAVPQPNSYAVVIGVEKYVNGLPSPTGAHSDAERFAQLAKSTLGIDPGHLEVLLDERATKAGIGHAITWAAASVSAGGRIYLFFSGHGAPDAASGSAYLVPSDGDPRDLDTTAIAMKEVLSKLGQSKAKEVLAIVDSCFSGAGGRSVLPPGARPLVRLKEEVAPAQLALFSASSGTEISGPVPGGGGGLFTKYLLDGLGSGAADINGDGQVSLAELSEWVSPRVAREAKKDNRDQNPGLTLGKGLGSADAFIVAWGLPAK
jgi:hypothetical protein